MVNVFGSMCQGLHRCAGDSVSVVTTYCFCFCDMCDVNESNMFNNFNIITLTEPHYLLNKF